MYAKKSLGQHFLRCGWVTQTLIEAASLAKTDTLLEIGPGTGVLTRELARHAKEVVAIEKDEKLADALADALAREEITNVRIIKGDILWLQLPQTKFGAEDDLNLVWGKNKSGYKVVANIPYYLTSRLLRLLLGGEPRPERIVLTIQKEVAERIVAKPPHMNLLALSVQAFGAPEIIKNVPASCFTPKPDVDSAIIRIAEISDRFFMENRTDPADFFGFVRRGFSQKRKQLLNTLKGEGETPKKTVADALIRLGLSPNARPEELSLQNWADLAKKIPQN